MIQAILTEVLAMALVVLVALYLRQVPGVKSGEPATRPAVLQWIGIFLAIWFGLQIVLGIILGIAISAFLLAQGANPADFLTLFTERIAELTIVSEFVSLVSVLAAAYVGQVLMRHRSILDFGWRPYRGWGWDSAMGLFLGFIGFALLFGLAIITGQVTVGTQGTLITDIIPGLLLTFVTLIMVAFTEELLIRGYILQVIEIGWGTIAAVVLSSLFWGILHLLNPSASGTAALNIVAAGMIYGLGYVITRGLWLPFFLHLSWNVFQGPVFGFTVSGLNFPSIFKSTLAGPDFVTGGGFGPEAGLVVIPILVLQILILRWWMGVRPKLGIETPGTNGH